ncbi:MULTISPECIES: RluA family pseudouridine synthase [unclassified Nitratiruptor]|uniref:RluA family pseudouridine synthase n=1 Tax=unclassified Nitratiruptor TaxID=2624044 RepID=UPI0019150D94|nr:MULTISPECIES: RluA family pseudouridine synthase [unclassified Nitratiruptor]BCD59318.1 23S rRNA pseudouridine1911/1915/1917 synthase [Nitratiruptor sp. YY08-10]BCD63242.1 23S rRNA pseudouridine1911/1915/1917 synthase [Nitratiruptor sp. YY08-14]
MPFIRKIIKTNKPIKLFLLLMRSFNISQSQAQKMIDTRKIYQNGKLITDKSAVVEGELEVVVFEPVTKGLEPIFETKDFVLYDKPSGIMVHPRNRNTHYTLIDEIRYRYGPQANIVHRIDKETSGLVLASTNKEAEKALKQMFEHKQIQKRYLALVRGNIEKQLVIEEPIALNRDYSKIKLKVKIDPNGKYAKTIINPLKQFGSFTLVEAIPITGRQHQIRIHLFHVKHPILGDPIYGPTTEDSIRYLDGLMDERERVVATGAKRLMLHAHTVEFTYKDTQYKIVSNRDFLQEYLTSLTK